MILCHENELRGRVNPFVKLLYLRFSNVEMLQKEDLKIWGCVTRMSEVDVNAALGNKALTRGFDTCCLCVVLIRLVHVDLERCGCLKHVPVVAFDLKRLVSAMVFNASLCLMCVRRTTLHTRARV